MPERIIGPDQLQGENEQEHRLRPHQLMEFTGQEILKENLSIAIQAARLRQEPLDHCLFAGPPGLGKTTLAGIIAQEMDAKLHITSGPILDKASDLAGLLTGLSQGDILFIDEIHRLSRVVEEYLYSAMEDFRLDIMLDSGAGARSLNLPLQPFTLVGATTRSGLLTSPLRDRFGLQFRLELYTEKELQTILQRSAKLLNIPLENAAAGCLSSKCRGTPRIANRILRRCRDVAQVRGDGIINQQVVDQTLKMLGIDQDGLDPMDRRILETLIDQYEGGPVGMGTLGATMGEEADTLEEVYEPYLLQQGLLARTPRGRCATLKAYQKLNRKRPAKDQTEMDL